MLEDQKVCEYSADEYVWVWGRNTATLLLFKINVKILIAGFYLAEKSTLSCYLFSGYILQ